MDFTRPLLTTNHAEQFLQALKAAGGTLTNIDPERGGLRLDATALEDSPAGADIFDRIGDLERMNWRSRGHADAAAYFNTL